MYPGRSVSSFGYMKAVSQGVVEVGFLLVAPLVGVASTLGVLEKGVIEASSVSLF